MNPAIANVAAQAVGILLPFVSKSAKEFVAMAGEVGYEKTKSLLERLKTKWRGDAGSTVVLENFERQPEQFRPALEAVLQQSLENDPELREAVSTTVREVGPVVDITQKLEEAERVTGLRAEEMASGKASITQEIRKGTDITGAELGRLG